MISVRRCSLRALNSRASSTSAESAPQYPEIKDITWRGRRKDEAAAWSKKIQDLGTIEEKLIVVNMPRFYGWKCIMLREGMQFYDSLPLCQHMTKTHLVDGLPSIYNTNDAEKAATQFANEVKAEVEDALVFEMSRSVPKEISKPQDIEAERVSRVIESLSVAIVSKLGKHYPHLRDAVSTPKPRLEASWNAGGFDIDDRRRKTLEKSEGLKELLDWPVDRRFRYIGKPVLQLRTKQPLQQILDIEQSKNEKLEVPIHNLDPRVKGIGLERGYVSNIPGFWPGDESQFGTISFFGKEWTHAVDFPEEEMVELTHSHAILSSFSWLLGQACYQGFSPYNDITYPLVSQTIISNGQNWSFYTYQLNTTLVQFDEAHPKRNICWSSKPMSLFNSIEAGKIQGFNIEVLKTLLKFYLNEPKERAGVDMTPYLNKSAPTLAKIDNQEQRIFQEQLFKNLFANRDKFQPDPEYWDWEWIYKIRNKMRSQEARRRPFELWQDPWKKSFYERKPRYVPKALRENEKDVRQKYQKSYYP